MRRLLRFSADVPSDPPAVGTAAGKGDHRPARDLLVHTRTIQPVADLARGSEVKILVMGNVVIPGLTVKSVVDGETE